MYKELTHDDIYRIDNFQNSNESLREILNTVLEPRFYINHPLRDKETLISKFWRRATQAQKNTPILLQEYLGICQQLIDRGADPHTIVLDRDKSYKDLVLNDLMMNNNKVLFDFLLQANLSPNHIPDKCSWNNLLGAARLPHGLYYLKEMVKHGLDIKNVSLEDSKNPVAYAVENNCIEVARYLIEHQSPYEAYKNFHRAVFSGHREIAEIIAVDNLEKLGEFKTILTPGFIPQIQIKIESLKKFIEKLELTQTLENTLTTNSQVKKHKI